MTDNKKTDRECLPKLATGIRGLDKLLYDGINVNTADGDNNILIVVKGDVEENDKTLLGMQILYGLAQSIESIKNEYTKFEGIVNQPVMYSTYYKQECCKNYSWTISFHRASKRYFGRRHPRTMVWC